MKYGLHFSNYAEYADPRTLAALASEAEAAGWDGFFTWDHLATARSPLRPALGAQALVDPWVALCAVALSTERIRIGPRVTPLPRRRPWQLARQAASLDHLSGGRLILAVGAGNPLIADEEFGAFGEETDAQVRAAMLDEGLAVLAGLWRGVPFSYRGAHYRVREATFLPPPVQQPRIPIWVAATWPSRAPLRRAADWDGVCLFKRGGRLEPDELKEIVRYIEQHRAADAAFDITMSGQTPGDNPQASSAIVAPFAAAGLTWWMELIGPERGPFDEMRARIRQGPPRV
jgi:alkanesulfonate monooxygenase SsuD/methylene tetrahydromethanopterin reductase-like flavin-dependent oxidoreductase (luciferase family)